MDLLQHALSLHQAGQLDAAYGAYISVLKKTPKDLNALNFLGVLCFQRGDVQEGCRFLRKCLQLRPDFAQAHNNLGNGLLQGGNPKEALTCFLRAVALKPDYAEAHFNLAKLWGASREFAKAQKSAKQATACAPNFAPAWAVLASSCYELNDYDDALQAAERAESLLPGLRESGLVRARVAWVQERYLDAIAAYRAIIGQYSDDRDAMLEFGSRLVDAGRADEALPYLERLNELAPADLAGLEWLGTALRMSSRAEEAETVFQRLVDMAPERMESYLNLSEVLKVERKFLQAEAAARKALALQPLSAPALSGLASVLSEMGRLDEAFDLMDRLLESTPDNLDLLSCFLCNAQYSTRYSPSHLTSVALRYGELARRCAVSPFSDWTLDPSPNRLRVGFVSGDLLTHPVGLFLDSVISRLDFSRIELIAYPTTRNFDDLSLRLMPHMLAWKPLCGMSDEAAAAMIRADGVHILFDLSGHTEHHRLPLFAWRPAPVQVSWLGYFATTGLLDIDWFLADPVSAPPTMDALFSEKIWRLPETRMCFSPPQESGDVAPLPALASGYVTFGCFQNIKKIGEKVLLAWAAILAELPSARLRVQCSAFGDPAVENAFRSRFRAAGGDVDRLVLKGPMSRQDYLSAHRKVDIILDTFPFPGGATTCEALWMGVPTLTLAGDSLVSRQGASMMTAAGLGDWVVSDVAEYVNKAIAFADDLQLLSAQRGQLRQKIALSELFAGERFAKDMVSALEAMWQRFRQQSASQ